MTDKIIHDPVHGSILVDGMFLDLVNRHEIQRLRCIKQLGLSSLVFPGANHTRFEHSIGTYHLAGRMSRTCSLNRGDSDTVRAAALFHDVCHPPFSHTLESVLEEVTGCDHMELSRRLIHGTVPTYMERDEGVLGGTEPVSVIIEDNGISPDEVCDLIMKPVSDPSGLDVFTQGEGSQSFFSSKDYMHQIIHGPVDADQMDYLMRDAHYTGVNHGAIDTERILGQMMCLNGKIVLRKGGIPAAEGLMVSRSLMYSSIYYHKTVKIVEAMLRRAVELSGLDLSELYLMADHDLLSSLISSGGRSAELTGMILRRQLFKKAYVAYHVDLGDRAKATLVGYSTKKGRRKLEEEIADASGTDPGDIIVDIPSESVLLSKIRIGKTDVSIADGDKVRSITRYSSLAKSLQARDTIDWAVMVSAPDDVSEKVGAAARRVLSLDDSDRF